MTFADRLHQWNLWYDELPREWRFQFVLWPLILLGAVNILLTVSTRFPFGLLLLLGILIVAMVRVPFMLGHGRTALAGEGALGRAGGPSFQISGADWLVDLNRRYDAMPEFRRFWVLPAVLVVVGAINMLLTIGSGFPFGLLFLLALLVMVALRAPFTAGWLKASESGNGTSPTMPYNHAIDHASTPAVLAEPAKPIEPANTATPAPDSPSASVDRTVPPTGLGDRQASATASPAESGAPEEPT